MLFFAWTVFQTFSACSHVLELLELSFRKLLISMFIFPLSRQNCNSITHLITERPSNLLKNLLNYLFVCFSYSVFNDHFFLLGPSLDHIPLMVSGGLKWTRTTLQRSAFYRFALSARYTWSLCPKSADFGGLKWTRTTDLALIRRAL